MELLLGSQATCRRCRFILTVANGVMVLLIRRYVRGLRPRWRQDCRFGTARTGRELLLQRCQLNRSSFLAIRALLGRLGEEPVEGCVGFGQVGSAWL